MKHILAQNIPLLLLFLVGWSLLVFGADYGMPIPIHPDEVAQLKNIYGLIQHQTFVLPYDTAYSAWLHYFYIIPTLLYWGGVYLLTPDIQSIDDLKVTVFNDYQYVLPFLRVWSATLYALSVGLVYRMLKQLASRRYAILFVIFALLTPWVVINAHTIKHWIPDFTMLLFGFYFYWKSLNSESLSQKALSFVLIFAAIFTTYTLVFLAIYLLIIHLLTKPGKYLYLAKDAAGFMATGIAIFFLTSYLGTGKNIAHTTDSAHYAFDIKLDFLLNYLYVFGEFDPFLLIGVCLSVFMLLRISVQQKILVTLMLLPFILNWIVMSAYSIFGNYYAVYFTFASIPIAAFVFQRLLETNFLWKIGVTSYLVFAFIINALWLDILTTRDTRLLASDWIKQQNDKNYFYIYNTLGFNYLPYTKESLMFLRNNFPLSMSMRESMMMEHTAYQGVPGVILWKVIQAGYKFDDLIVSLKQNGFAPVFVNERFGTSVYNNEKHENLLPMFEEKCDFQYLKRFEPYSDVVDNQDLYGDIALDFRNLFLTLLHVERSGPVVSIDIVKRCESY